MGAAMAVSALVLPAMADVSSRMIVSKTVDETLTDAVRASRKSAVHASTKPIRKADAGDVTMTVNVDIDDDGWDEVCNVLAIRIVNGVPEVRQFDLGFMERLWEDETLELDLPAGVYDFMLVGHTEREEPEVEGIFILVEENVNVAETQEITLNIEDATHHTRFERRGPDGNPIELEGTGEVDFMIDYKGFEIYEDQVSLMTDGFQDLFINRITDNFKVTRLDICTTHDGVLSYVEPVDFSKETIGATSEGWQSAEVTFNPTPVNLKVDEWAASSSKNKKPYLMKYSTMVEEERIGTTITVVNDAEAKINKVWSWAPEGYDNRYEFLLFPTGNTVGTKLSCAMYGLPFRRSLSGDSMYQVGRNFMNQNQIVNALTYTAESVKLTPGNPRYSGVVDNATICGGVPALVLLPFPNGTFEYGYIGRHGEDMEVDAADLAKEISVSSLVQFLESKSPSTINVKVDDTEYVTTRGEFTKFKYPKGKYDVEITMDNVLINGGIAGSNKTVMHFDNTDGQEFPPTVTALQFRDKDDKIADEFENTDGTLEFFAADFTSQTHKSPNYAYATTSTIKSVEVSYSPSGKNEWMPMDVVEIPELYFMPGYGYCYRGNLSQVKAGSDNKWYDLKLRLADESGAYQEQILAPAFRIEKVDGSGVESVLSDNGQDEVRVYNLNGILVSKGDPSGLDAGVYIIRKGTVTRKLIVK